MSGAAIGDDASAAGDFERWLYAYAFRRVDERRASLKRRLTCGHWIDGGEPYRYSVWRVNLQPRGELEQRTDCEFCARVDLRG